MNDPTTRELSRADDSGLVQALMDATNQLAAAIRSEKLAQNEFEYAVRNMGHARASLLERTRVRQEAERKFDDLMQRQALS